MSARNVLMLTHLGRRGSLAVWECDEFLNASINLILRIRAYGGTKRLTW
jgi:hypothetical protein